MVRKILPWLAGALKTASLELRKVESDLAAPDSAPNWICKDDYSKNATAAATASARMMLINIILTVPVLAIRSTDCITPCLQALFCSSFVYSLCMGQHHVIQFSTFHKLNTILPDIIVSDEQHVAQDSSDRFENPI